MVLTLRTAHRILLALLHHSNFLSPLVKSDCDIIYPVWILVFCFLIFNQHLPTFYGDIDKVQHQDVIASHDPRVVSYLLYCIPCAVVGQNQSRIVTSESWIQDLLGTHHEFVPPHTSRYKVREQLSIPVTRYPSPFFINPLIQP